MSSYSGSAFPINRNATDVKTQVVSHVKLVSNLDSYGSTGIEWPRWVSAFGQANVQAIISPDHSERFMRGNSKKLKDCIQRVFRARSNTILVICLASSLARAQFPAAGRRFGSQVDIPVQEKTALDSLLRQAQTVMQELIGLGRFYGDRFQLSEPCRPSIRLLESMPRMWC